MSFLQQSYILSLGVFIIASQLLASILRNQ